MRIRPAGPKDVIRPFIPAIGLDTPPEQIADALDQIAVTLAALDHNVEVLVKRVGEIGHVLARTR